MRQSRQSMVLGFVVCWTMATSAEAEVKVDEQVMGPIQPGQQMWISPTGTHFTTVSSKGSRFVVIHDGSEGPKIDAVNLVYPTLTRFGSTSQGQIVYSDDGQRWGYVARIGNEFVVMVDGKELMRLPAPAGEMHMEFVGGGKRVAFSVVPHDHPDLYQMWLDGQPTPGFYNQMVIPSFSADGSRYAYPGVDPADRKKQLLVVDGKVADYVGFEPTFTQPSGKLLTIGQDDKGVHLQVDGQRVASAMMAKGLVASPAGDRHAIVMGKPSPQGARYYLVVDGKEVADTESSEDPKVIFSPDGQHWAASVRGANAAWVVTDGKKGQEYQGLDQLAFSTDSSKLSYVASGGGKTFVVINDKESDQGSDLGTPILHFGGGGKHAVYTVMQNGGKRIVVWDDKVFTDPAQTGTGSVTFSNDGARVAWYSGGMAMPGNGVPMIDGQPLAGFTISQFKFSPDGSHYAFTGQRQADGLNGIFVDSKPVSKNARPMGFMWSSDSKHLYWTSLEQQAPGSNPAYRPVLYVDGAPAVTFDRLSTSFSQDPSGAYYEMAADGSILFLAPQGDSIKRFTVHPTAETTIDQVAKNLEEADAKAKADAEAAKAKAAEDAAKAKANAEAARKKAAEDAAAAKAKAARDAAAMKAWKAENARRAKQGLPPLPQPDLSRN